MVGCLKKEKPPMVSLLTIVSNCKCYLNIIRHPQGRVGQPSILLKIPINMERFAAMSLFQPSNLRRAISESMDKTTKRMKYHLLGTMMGVPHTIMARNLGLLGFDFVFVDAQHA